MPDVPEPEAEPEMTELDELQTFVGSKQDKIWLWTAINHWQAGIIAWTIGARSSVTFQLLWTVVKCWQSFLDVTDGYAVYPKFIDDSGHVDAQDLYDTCGRGKYTIEALFGTPAPLKHSVIPSR